MALLIVTLGTALFVGLHLVPVMPGWRAALIGRIGEGPYKAVFALLSLAGLIGAIVAYRFTPHVALWTSPGPLRVVSALVMLVAVWLFAGARVPWFKRIVRHPMLWAIGLFGIAHLLVNGEPAGVVLFGGLALFGFAWQPLTDRRDAAVDPNEVAGDPADHQFLAFRGLARPHRYAHSAASDHRRRGVRDPCAGSSLAVRHASDRLTDWQVVERPPSHTEVPDHRRIGGIRAPARLFARADRATRGRLIAFLARAAEPFIAPVVPWWSRSGRRRGC